MSLSNTGFQFTKKNIFFIVLSFLIFLSLFCNNLSDSGAFAQKEFGFAPPTETATETNIPPGYKDKDYQKAEDEKTRGPRNNQVKNITEGKKLIKTGVVRLEVPSFEEALASVKKTVQEAGGYIENESSEKDHNNRTSGYLLIRIPAEKFDPVFDQVGNLGKLFSRSSQADDITMEYNDVALRMDNLRQLRKRLKHLLATRTGNLKDVAALEEKLAEVTGKIESLKGKLRYYDHNVAMSKIEVYLSEPAAVSRSSSTPLWKQLAEGFVVAWELFIGFVVFLISSMGILLPLGAIGYLAFRLIRKYRAKQPPKEKPKKKK